MSFEDLNDMEKASFVMGMGLAVILAVIFMPFLAIWSLNTLFGFSIAYTLKTWFAALVISGIVGQKVTFFNNDFMKK